MSIKRKQGNKVLEFGSGDTLILKSGATLEAQSGSTMDLPDLAVAVGDLALADGNVIVGDGTGKAVAVTLSGDVTASNAGVTAVGAGKVTNAMVTPAALDGTVAKVGAADNVIGAIPVLHRIDIAAGALANTDVVLTHKTRVIDAWLVLRGAGVANTTLQVKSTAAAITNAIAASGADQTLVRAGTIDDAAHEIIAGGILRVTSATGASQPDATVYVLGVRVA